MVVAFRVKGDKDEHLKRVVGWIEPCRYI